jgi:hypothetical protein
VVTVHQDYAAWSPDNDDRFRKPLPYLIDSALQFGLLDF